MKKRSVFILQNAAVVLTGGFLWAMIHKFISSFWVSLLIFIVVWIIVGWIEVAFLGLLDPEVRLANKLHIKIENLDIYRNAFKEIVEAERRGEEVGWIGDKLPDEGEWLRYLRYVMEKELDELCMPH